jgi:hypothetical protein
MKHQQQAGKQVEPEGWTAKWIADDGTVSYDDAAIRAANEYGFWRRPRSGHAPRMATNTRVRGSRRRRPAAKSTSSRVASRGDPDDLADGSEPPTRRHFRHIRHDLGRRCARCGLADVAAVSWATLEPICGRCRLGLPPLRPGDVGVGLEHPCGRAYIAVERAAA